MANDYVKGLTIEIGGDTTPLGAALKKAEAESRGASREISKINQLLKAMPERSVELLTQKQAVLGTQIESTKKKVELLKAAEEKAAAALKNGDIGEQEYRALQREVFYAESALKSLEKKAEANAKALKEAGEAGDKAGAEVKDGMEDAAEGAKAAEKQLGRTNDEVRQTGEESENAKGKVSSFADVLKGTLAAKAIEAGAKAVVNGIKNIASGVKEEMDELGDLDDNAQKVQMSAEALQEWQYVAKLSGMESQTLVKAMEKQQKSFADAKTGTDSLIASYAMLGIDVSQLHSSEDAFEAVIRALAKCEDETTRNAVANDLFGKSYAELAPLLNLSTMQIADLRKQARDLGLVLSDDMVTAGAEFGDTLDILDTKLTATKQKIIAGMIPGLKKAGEQLTKALDERSLKKTGEQLGKLAERGGDLAANALPKLVNGLSFVTRNGKELAITAAALVVAFRGFSIVNTITTGIHACRGAVTKLNTAIASNPIGAALTAVAALVAGIQALTAAEHDAIKQQEEVAQSFREAGDAALAAQRSRQLAMQDIRDEYARYQDLADGLHLIADGNGRIKEQYAERAEFITNRLAEATGVEIELVDGVIQKYDELSAAIGDVLIKKEAEAMMSDLKGDYSAARDAITDSETDSDGNYTLGSQAAAEQALAKYQQFLEARADNDAARAELERKYAKKEINDYDYMQEDEALSTARLQYMLDAGYTRTGALRTSADAAESMLRENYQNAQTAYDSNRRLMNQYEALQSAIWRDDPEAMQEAIENAANAQMTAEEAALLSLERQRDDAVADYLQWAAWAETDGTSITADELKAKRQYAETAAIEAFKKLVDEGSAHSSEEAAAARAELASLLAQLNGGEAADYAEQIAQIIKDATNKRRSAPSATPEDSEGGGPGRPSFALWAPTTTHAAALAAQQIAAQGTQTSAQPGFGALIGALNGSPSGFDLAAWAESLSTDTKTRAEDIDTQFRAVGRVLDDILAAVEKIEPNLVLDGDTLVAKTAQKTDEALYVLGHRSGRGKIG